MILLGKAFCGDRNSLSTTPTSIDNINYLTVQNGVFDEVFLTKQAYTVWDGSIPQKWDFDTVLHALFKETLYAGNVDYTSDTVTSIRIKRREEHTFLWDTLFEIPIEKEEDFKFVRQDTLNRSNVTYEYAFVPTYNGAEGNYNINSIISEFDGIFLVERDIMYHAILNTSLSITRNRTSSSIITIGKKYPYAVYNGDSNYTSITMQATFIDYRCPKGEFDIENGWKYRQQITDFLTNGKPKILKNFEGKMWLVSIIDTIAEDSSQHYLAPVHTISAIETGDYRSTADLYDNHFIDVDVDRR